jgi:Fe-S-cluster containining protein
MKSIAYKGKIGRKRDAFCVGYIERKAEVLSLIRKKLASAELEAGKKVTCAKGCTICCSMYIEASIQECEAIVYYLYHDDGAMASFLRSYPGWREALRRQGDIFKGRSKYWEPQPTVEKAASLWREFTEEEDGYFAQGILCPFLSEGLCSIYEVRPYVCASYAAVTPPEYCRSGSENQPKIVKAIPHGVRSDLSFYHLEQLSERVLSTMQIMVYEILKSGLTCFSAAGIKGLEALDAQWLADPEVSAVYRKYLR